MEDQAELFNGVNGSTGQYLPPPMTGEEIRRNPGYSVLDPVTRREREWLLERYGIGPDRGWARDVDPCDLASAGWGVLFAPGVGAGVKDALRPLLELRREQAARIHPSYYVEETCQPEQSKEDFLAGHNAGFGPANPENLPYYLLIVGDPDTLPFRFQYELDVQYAVGRIHFDRDEDYASYAESVVAVENGTARRPKRLTFFGVSHDPATERAVEHLVKPLADSVLCGRNGWEKSLLLGEDASKAELERLLSGRETPAILFTSSHGLKYEPDDERQRSNQGALLCQDWLGRSPEEGPVDPAHYFSAHDLKPGTDLTGLLAIHFACYSAGTPELDNFSISALSKPQRVAPYPFVSALGKRLLSCGALAILGHIDRAWDFSFDVSGTQGSEIDTFDSTLKTLLDGEPVGAATEYVNQRYADLSVRLSNLLIDQAELRGSSKSLLARIKRANNDARNYVVVGDPAVRLPV